VWAGLPPPDGGTIWERQWCTRPTSRALAGTGILRQSEANEAPDDLLMAEAAVPDELIETLDLEATARNWRSLDNHAAVTLVPSGPQVCGRWRSRCPSVVVDGLDVLLNPKASEFTRSK